MSAPHDDGGRAEADQVAADAMGITFEKASEMGGRLRRQLGIEDDEPQEGTG